MLSYCLKCRKNTESKNLKAARTKNRRIMLYQNVKCVMFIRLLTSLVNRCNHSKCVSWSNQICIIHSNLINLHRNEYSQ